MRRALRIAWAVLFTSSLALVVWGTWAGDRRVGGESAKGLAIDVLFVSFVAFVLGDVRRIVQRRARGA